MYNDTDPERAQQFVNRLRDAYTSEVVERYRNDARAVRDALQNQLALAQDAYRDKERQATELRRKHGLSNTQQAPGGGREREEDPIFTQLNQARKEAAETMVKVATEEAALEVLRTQHAEAPREVPQASVSSGLDYDAPGAKDRGRDPGLPRAAGGPQGGALGLPAGRGRDPEARGEARGPARAAPCGRPRTCTWCRTRGATSC